MSEGVTLTIQIMISTAVTIFTSIGAISLMIYKSNKKQEENIFMPEFGKLHERLDDHDEVLNDIIEVQKEHSSVYDKFVNQESYFRELDRIRDTTIQHIQESDSAMCYVSEQVQSAKDMFIWLDQQNVGTLTPEIFEGWAKKSVDKGRMVFFNHFGQYLMTLYFNEHGKDSQSFIDDIEYILLDEVNDKLQAIKFRTLDFTRRITSNFVKFYFKEILKAKEERSLPINSIAFMTSILLFVGLHGII